MELLTISANETKNFGQKTATSLVPNESGSSVFALSGDLGSGKTTFVQGFAAGLGITSRVTSPTFILLRQYSIPAGKFRMLYHIDLYRLEGNVGSELDNIGFAEFVLNPANIVLVEWAEKARSQMPDQTRWLEFQNLGDDRHKIVER